MSNTPLMDEQSFLTVIERYGPELLTRAESMLGSADEARKCLMECYVLARKVIVAYKDQNDLYEQIYELLMRCCLNSMKSKVSSEREQIEDLLPKFDEDGCRVGPDWEIILSEDDILGQPNSKQLVIEALDQLPNTYRYVFYLRDIEGFTLKEVADCNICSVARHFR